MRSKCFHPWAALATALVCAAGASAQSSRITQALDNRQRTVLAGNIHPKALTAAQAGNDQGRVAPSLQVPYITLTLAPSASQQAALNKLLVEQQTPGSPQYHRWLTPAEFATRFGPSKASVASRLVVSG